MRYQPAGERGVALFTRGLDFGGLGHEGVAERHRDLLSIVQIESRAALEDVEAIAGVEGIDVLFVGPTDLSHALGIPGRLDDPAFGAALSRVGHAARTAGKAAGALVASPEDVGRYQAEGFTVLGISSEASILSRALHSTLDSARRAGPAAPHPEGT
jgi:4-hydroxy-2-oxoheptanedioate aldolase